MEFDLSNCVAFITSATAKRVTEDFNRRLEKHGTTRIQWIALYFLHHATNPISQKELAAQMNVQDPSLARLMDRMERDGLVQRIENPEDRRMKFIVLTDLGRKKATELMPMGDEFSRIILKGIPEEKIGIFLEVLQKLNENLDS